MDRQTLHNTLSIQSESYNTERMQRYIERFVRNWVPTAHLTNDDGNIYITKGDTDVFPCIIAHTDTVHDIIPDFVVNVRHGIYYGKDRKSGKQYGVGGDDDGRGLADPGLLGITWEREMELLARWKAR